MSRTNSRLDFAPVSSVPSSLVRFAGGYFVFNGATLAIMVVLALIAPWIGDHTFALTIPNLVVLLCAAIAAAGFIWSGVALWRGRRVGGWIMLGLVLLPIAGAVLTRQPPGTTNIVFGLIALIILALVWRDLK